MSFLPPALDVLRRVESVPGQLATLRDETEVRSRLEALNVEIRTVNATATEGPPTRLGLLDVESIVRRWRDRAASRSSA